MNINKIVLKNEGFDGMQVKGTVLKEVNNRMTLVDRTETIKVPIPKNIIEQLNRLRIPLLWLTNYWDKELNQFIEADEVKDMDVPENKIDAANYHKAVAFLDDTTITGINVTKHGGIEIMGRMSSFISTPFDLCSPPVDQADGFPEYDLIEKIKKSVFNLVSLFLENDNALMMDPKQFLNQYADDDKKEEIQEMSAEEAEAEMIRKLEQKGAVVLMPDEHEIAEKKEIVEEVIKAANEDEAKEANSIADMTEQIVKDNDKHLRREDEKFDVGSIEEKVEAENKRKQTKSRKVKKPAEFTIPATD